MPFPLHSLLLAEIGDPLRRAPQTWYSVLDAPSFGAAAAGLAIGVLIVWWHALRRGPRKEQAIQSPQRLFGELCRVHRLGAAQRRLLEWLATDRQLVQPAMVFLDSVLLEGAIARNDSPSVRKRLAELRAKLFSER